MNNQGGGNSNIFFLHMFISILWGFMIQWVGEKPPTRLDEIQDKMINYSRDLTYQSWGSSENHRLKKSGWEKDIC